MVEMVEEVVILLSKEISSYGPYYHLNIPSIYLQNMEAQEVEIILPVKMGKINTLKFLLAL